MDHSGYTGHDHQDQSSPFTGPLPQTTDVIISQYENVINKKISSKILSSKKTGHPVVFTDEETCYLTKKAIDDNSYAEINVETSSPELTLKKGNTEIKIKHAAAILKKMDEKYPLGVSNDAKENIFKRPFVDESIKYGLSNPPDESEVLPMPIQTVNKNAYEIRTDILAMALDLVKWQTEVNLQMAKESNQTLNVGSDVPKSDIVLDVAKKFYAFVENRRY